MPPVSEDPFRDQILGILKSAAEDPSDPSHRVWVEELLAALQAAEQGEAVSQESQETSRLFFLACGLEEATDKPSFRLPEYGEVRSAKQVVSKYLASLATEHKEDHKAELGPAKPESAAEEPAVELSDVALAEMLSRAWQDEAQNARPRVGQQLRAEKLIELGAAFERQPDGSDTCAIHGLNNLLQPKRSSKEAALKFQEAMDAALKDEQNPEERSTAGLVGPFSLATLQAADAESRAEEMACRGFVPPRAAQLSLLRQDSGFHSSRGLQRTGMFDVEAIKIAARLKGFEVVDVEPKPSWHESDVSKFAALGANSDWFRGFLVYERMPGRAMHYYSILYWPHGGSHWMILDSFDRGDESPRNRLLTLEEVVSLHDQNGEFFRSWLLRWYPVVDRAAAIQGLRDAVHVGLSQVELEEERALSEARAEVELDASRWNVADAAARLLQYPRQVTRELQVLQLVVSEQQARASLEDSEWNFTQAVEHLSNLVLQRVKDVKAEFVDQEHERLAADAYAALSLTDWDVRTAAQLLLLREKSKVSFKAAATALTETNSLQQALLVLQLLAEVDIEDAEIDEVYAASLLRYAEDVSTARQLAHVCHQFPSVPLALCAEALRRGESQAAACMMLQDFQDQVCRVVSALAQRASNGQGEALGPQECLDIARLALEAAEWSPDNAFILAESYALGVLQVRKELGLLQKSQAFAVQQEKEESKLATALSALDAVNELQTLPPRTLLAHLQDCDMNPAKAVAQLWSQQTGEQGIPRKPALPKPPGRGARSTTPNKKGRDSRDREKRKDCVTM
ncbi:unnamed protein product [Effrenium voratum]|uniref:Uncharacterized protein n=1 Tax=Effrenium voratum TaxID=2562239 RepID=A0AA36NFX8_9DINO|nr:unnamed protein product [Effrenium voratum]CAJ1416217.1 unnamed protein product [Effrenium voratum]